jgi:molybdenum cofactor cytidylyltransferase
MICILKLVSRIPFQYPAAVMRSLESIIPIILAAGDSTRMGHSKALLPFGNRTFLAHIMETVRTVGLATPVVILGRSAAVIQPAIGDLPASIQTNPDPDRGQLSSIQIGLSSLSPNTQAAMIWPVDQPAVSETLVRRLAQRFVQSDCLMAFPKYEGKRGHPAILHCSVFKEFLNAPLREGPKKIILCHLQELAELTTDESAVIQDIDTPSEYAALTGESVQSALARLKAVAS